MNQETTLSIKKENKKLDVNTKKESKDTVHILLKSAYWSDEGRHDEGTVVEVDISTAKELIADDKAERADPL